MTAGAVLPRVPCSNLNGPCLAQAPQLDSWLCRFLFHHFWSQTASTLFPLCDLDFKTRLVHFALGSQPLLDAILASACAHHSRLISNGSDKDHYNSLYFTNRSVQGLLVLSGAYESCCRFEMFLTAIVLCTSGFCSGQASSGRTHLKGALTLLSLGLQDPSEDHGLILADPFHRTLLKWSSSLTIFADHLTVGLGDRRTQYLDKSSEPSYGSVDEFTGYSLELMPVLAQVNLLAYQRHKQRKYTAIRCGSYISQNDDILCEPYISQIRDIEFNLLGMLNRRVARTTSGHLATKTLLEMEKCHSIFVYTALIHLCRRVQGLSRDHSKVQDIVTKCMDLLRGIEAESITNVLLLWPIFTAGCETNDWVYHTEALARLQSMKRHGMGCIDIACRMMSEYWTCPTTECWDKFSEERGYDIVFF